MKISKNGQYALVGMADLAMHAQAGCEDCESLARIAERQNIDARYLGQIFFALKNAGLVQAVRGKNGGYYLERPAEDITAGEVVRAVEGELKPTWCSLDDKAAQSCESYDECMTRRLWQDLARQINDTLDTITIADIVQKYQEGGNQA